MTVRIRFHPGRRVSRSKRKNARLALGVAALLVPVALLTFVLAFWRIGEDLGFARQFFLHRGVLSHWQVWFAIATLIQIVIIALNRYGNSRELLPNSEEQRAKSFLKLES